MNNKELAKLLLKHPIIKKINESQMWDKSVVSRVIAEELLKEANRAVFIQGMARRLAARGEGEEAKRFYDQAIELFTDQIEKLDDELLELDIGLDGASNNEIAAARIKEKNLKKEIADVKVALINFENSYEKAKNLAPVQEDEPEVSNAVEEVGTTLDQIAAKTKEFEELAAEVERGSEDAVDKFYKVESELRDLRKKLSDEEGNAANATKEPEEKKDAAPAQKLQAKVEEVSEMLSNFTLAATAGAVIAPPTAPISLAAGKAAGIGSTTLDLVALGLAFLNDDKEGMVKNATSLTVGTAMAFVPGGEATKKPAKELAKQALEKGLTQAVRQGLSQIKDKESVTIGNDTFTKTQLEKLGREILQRAGEITQQKIENKSQEELEQIVNDASGKVEDKKALETERNFLVPFVGPKDDQEADEIPDADTLDKQKYINLTQGLMDVGILNNELLKSDLVKIYAAWWIMQETNQKMMEASLGVDNTKLEDFKDSGILDGPDFQKLATELRDSKDKLKSLIDQLSSFTKPNTDEQKEKVKGQLIPLSKNEEVPKEPIYAIAKIVDDTGETLKRIKGELEPTPQQSTAIIPQEEVRNDVENQPEVEQFEYDEAVKQEMTTFFADEGANGLGFMQQILLRDQAAQLLGLIRNLDTIIEGPNAGEEKALTTGNEPEAEKQEEPEVSQTAEEPTLEPQPVQEQAKQLPPLSEEEKSNIKKRMTGMVTLLKELRTTSKSYEEYMTRTSRNPRLDGSTLKKRLDETLPEVQRLIAEMVQDLKRYSTDSTIKESLMLEKDGMSRDEKIAFVKQEYLKMREVWIRMKPAFSDKEEKSGIINQAKEMKAIAANKDFLALFPNVTFVSEGEVISIDQANKVLSETIEQFVFAMRDVLTLVKSDRPERNSLIVAQKRLEAIAKAIQDNFGVPMGIPPELQIQQIEDEAQDEDSQALTDEDQESRIDRLKQFLSDTKEKIGDWLSQMREKFGESFDEYWRHLKEISGEASGFIKELFSEIAKVPGEAMDFISEALKNLVFFLKKSTQEERAALKELMKKARTKTLDTAREIPEASKRIANNTIKFLKDAGIYMKVANRELLDVSASLYEDFKAILGPKFEKLQANTRAAIFALFLMMSKPRDIKVEEPTPISRSEDALEEALKPIITKMLKEHYG